METYDVNLDSFMAADAGIVVRDIRDVMMLYFRAKAEEVVLAADNRREVYRRIKALIEDNGIASAFDAWKSSYENSRRLAQAGA